MRARVTVPFLGLALAAGAAALWWWTAARGLPTFDLPDRLPIHTVVAELASVLPADTTARVGPLAPRHGLLANAGARAAVIAPPGTSLPLRLRLPAGALLEFSVGVERKGPKNPDAAGIRFAVQVNGIERWARIVNPEAHHDDRIWFDQQIDIQAEAGRDSEIIFATEAVGPGPAAGIPGWSGVRVVARRWRSRQAAEPAHPNVLVLLVDTLRADRLGCYGAAPSNSPTLDRLASRGTLFEHAVAHAPWTLPSAATLLTGLHPPEHGALGEEGQVLRTELLTLAEAAAAAGVTTFGVSANPLVSRGTNFAQGFETFVDLDREARRERGRLLHSPAGAADVNATFLRWLARNHRYRFLAYLHYMDPHHPYEPPAHLRPQAPPGVRRRVAAGRLDPWGAAIRAPTPFQLPAAELAHVRRLYDGEVRGWDEELARLLAALDRLGVLDTTVILVTSDHGEGFQEHGRLQHGMHLYDELLRVPFIVVGPGIAARRVAEQAQGIDVFPTVAGLLDLPPPAGLPGRNVLTPGATRPAFSMTRSGRLPDGRRAEIVSVRTPAAKLIWAPSAEYYEFYDLTRDPGEQVNRWGTSAAGPALAETLARWRSAAAEAPPAAPDPTFRERLRALGYAE